MSKEIFVGASAVGPGHPVFVIAEAGVNHNGDLQLAKQLVDAASDCGADAIKFQTYRTEDLVTSQADMAAYQKDNTGKEESQFDMLKRLELSKNQFEELAAYASDKGIVFLTTPHTIESVDDIKDLVSAVKIGSADLNNHLLLQRVAELGKPILLSTGMATLDEVKSSVRVLRDAGCTQLVVLHCTTNYPCPADEVNLRAMHTLRDECDTLVGFSDHTQGDEGLLAAVAMGACVLEKHLTLDRSMVGPDHKASCEPVELKQAIDKVRTVEIMLGSSIKEPTASESQMAQAARKSLVASKDISQGTVISEEMLSVKRPGTGLPPEKLGAVLGKKASRDISKDTLISLDDVGSDA